MVKISHNDPKPWLIKSFAGVQGAVFQKSPQATGGIDVNLFN
jgi:hypothetical protein